MIENNNTFDIIVIGAGHAGCEAALASARLNKKTALFTLNLDTIANMPCNPSIGGISKGQIVREIDALGGEIGRNTDKALISFNMINISKGAAVISPRAQCDKIVYHIEMKKTLENQENLYIKQDEIIDILTENDVALGVLSKTNIKYFAKAIILTSGTFLNGKIFIGKTSFPAGRMGEFPSIELSDNLKKKGFIRTRLKTGTPFRILKNSINFTDLGKYEGDEKIEPFSFKTDINSLKNRDFCYITYTNQNTHDIIKQNLKFSPLYSGKIKGIGPRYCPSIEDKVVKFPNMPRHQIFLEPISLYSNEIYCNGISSSLPEEVQVKFLHTIKGLENAIVTRIGYAIEYDFFQPTQLKPNLETKLIKNLFFAGQINGTTGYEEAAAQGLIAGINACKKIDQKEDFILKRYEAYIGVLIDDLVTKGVLDPYRMFTSRAEYRLMLRLDNVYNRLFKYGNDLGLIKNEDFIKFKKYETALENIKIELENIKEKGLSEAQKIRQNIEYNDWIKKSKILNNFDQNGYFNQDKLKKSINIEIRYKGYIDRQIEDVKNMEKLEAKIIPQDLDYEKIVGLLTETKKKLKDIRPKTLGQASRISGVNPTDIVLINIFLKKNYN